MIRQRRAIGSKADMTTTPPPVPVAAAGPPTASDPGPSTNPDAANDAASSPRWIFLSIASGACAAFNGAFAKLTTTGLTSALARDLASLFDLSSPSVIKAVELVVRGIFFGLNLTFNAIMWTLFTRALANGTSTTQVSIMNTSTNFVLTALLGFAIFSEALPPLWWAGAALLVAGNVVIGTKVEPAEDDSGPRDADDRLNRRDIPIATSIGPSEIVGDGERKPLLQNADLSGETSYANSIDDDAPHLGDLSRDHVG